MFDSFKKFCESRKHGVFAVYFLLFAVVMNILNTCRPSG